MFTRRWAAVTTFILFLVLAGGTLVTKTGSGDGCGDSWPLCYGKWLPPLNIHSIIEYSHRLVSTTSGIFVLVLAFVAWRQFGHRRDMRVLLSAAVFFLILQGGLGAWAVMAPQSPLVMALHFGVSLLAFAAVLLPYILMRQLASGTTHRKAPVVPQIRYALWFSLVYIYGVIYTGAYVTHSNAQLACLDWPLCNGALFPPLAGAVGIQFFHRLAAGASVLVLGYAWWLIRRHAANRIDLERGAAIAMLTLLLQILSGGLVVLAKLNLAATMLHSLIVIVHFGALSYLVLQATPEPEEAPSEARARAGEALAGTPNPQQS